MLIYDFDQKTLTDLVNRWEEPAYRAKQIWQGLYQHLYSTPEQFTNLPKPLRDRLAESLDFTPLKPKLFLDSSDQMTRKTLFELNDGEVIESVLMRYGDPADSHDTSGKDSRSRRTLCISTQAGCAMGCVFCATGQMGFARHLTDAEILEQAVHFAQQLRSEGERLSNVVLMGMGEPFHNYENSLTAVRRLMSELGIGARHITISTVGLVPQIRRFADEGLQVRLAISLHAATDEERAALLPVNRRYPLTDLMDACRYFVEKTGRRISFEWALIAGKNDTVSQAQALGRLLHGLMCHVNLIPLNPTGGFAGRPSDQSAAKQFIEVLAEYGVPATVRVRRGIDIDAGCGQLKAEVLRNRQTPKIEDIV